MSQTLRFLSPAQLDFYHENGYLHVKGVAPELLLLKAETSLRNWVNRVTRKWMKRGLISHEFTDLPFETRLFHAWDAAGRPHCKDMLVNEILNRELFEFMGTTCFTDMACDLLDTDRLITLRAFHGRAKLPYQLSTPDSPWHQDGQHPLTGGKHFIIMWVPLVTVDETNSCLQVAAGHHKDGIYPYHDHDYGNSRPYYPSDTFTNKLTRICPIPMRRGDVLIMDSACPHATMPNLRETVRWSMDMRYQALSPDEPALLSSTSGFVSAHPDPTMVETDFDACYQRLWGDSEQWRKY